jgi:hypothetical protein
MAALQVLLNIRGLPVKPKIFSVSQKVLQEKIGTIKIRERKCRHKITVETLTMEKDINVLLGSKSCSNEIRPVLQDVLKGLKSNRRHIEQGLDIHDLPYEIEHITLTDSDSQVKPEEEKKTTLKKVKKIRNNLHWAIIRKKHPNQKAPMFLSALDVG